MDIWTVATVEECISDRRAETMLCLVVDLPSVRAQDCLDAVRKAGIPAPALLVANSEDVGLRGGNAGWIDVLEKPVRSRSLLGWVACVCAAHIVIQRARVAAHLPRAA